MKLSLSIISKVILICFLGISCGVKTDDADNEKCGAQFNWVSDVGAFFIQSERIDPQRINLIYEDLTEPDNICVEVPLHINFQVDLDQSNYKGAYVGFYGKTYANLDSRHFTLDYNGSTKNFKSSVDLNLKPAFGDKPGWIGLQIIATVETNSDNIDSIKQFVLKTYPKMKIDLFYNEVK